MDPDGEDEPRRRTRPLAGKPAAEPGLLGRTVDGRYRLLAERGRGGMSVIHEALETPLGRKVALKSARGDDPAGRLRVLREAAILACLDHPGIPAIYTSGQTGELGPYFVTRLVDGDSLDERARRDATGWLGLLAAAAEAVAHAHARGIVHRDLKPAHILVDGRGVTVIDWGIAREVAGRAAVPALAGVAITEPGTAIGTPGYWAPEQRAGALPDPRADVYSFGVILARLVAGKEPDLDGPPELGRAPRALRSLVGRATAADARARLGSVAELAAELRRIKP